MFWARMYIETDFLIFEMVNIELHWMTGLEAGLFMDIFNQNRTKWCFGLVY